MSEAFDPYFQWLGIRPADQPPDHYRLLSIPQFESDPLLRTVTGTLFGALSVWLIYPYVNDSMRDTYAQSVKQLQRVSERKSVTG